jgi:predicted transcriptional regulator of viral defense system
MLLYKYLEEFIDEIRSNGRYSFTLRELRNQYQFSPEAIKKSLQRLRKKKKIVQVRKEFYVIVPPEYSAIGIIPPSFFIPDLMKFIDRDYYVGLLNAASYYGAGHQQPQEHFIITVPPTIRPISNRSIKISFCKKKRWDNRFVIDQKTEAGYLKISSPELTALDLVFYQDRVGGINRISTVLQELSEQIKPNALRDCAKTYNVNSVVQRLGFILENVLEQADLVKPMKIFLHDTKYFPLLLSTKGPKIKGLQIDNDWNILKNITVEPDL